MEKLLIVDDNAEIRKQLKWGLGREYRLLLAESADQALEVFAREKPLVVTLDLGLPPDIDGPSEGFRCLKAMLRENPDTKIIVLSGNDERENVLKAIELGAYDFYQKPIDLGELKVILRRAFNLAAIEAENRRLQIALAGEGESMTGMLGQCPQMQEVFAMVRRVATVDVPVLVLGESGTGKELVGRALHELSLRREQTFVPINCGAIPENLLESELFGHEKGAFTGAQGQVRGKFEYAHEGTLFLDEIGEMPASLQVKLLRFLQDKVIQRVGGREDLRVDARVIAATNIDIEKAIAEDRFREDLYYRIGVITINLPPLRERGDDIMLLARYFLKRSAVEFGRRLRGFSPAAMAALMAHEWPGNVRELENRVKRAVVMASGALVEAWDLDLAPRPEEAGKGASGLVGAGKDAGPVLKGFSGLKLKEARALVEKELLLAALAKHKGSVAAMAKELGVSRPTLYDLMKRHSLD
jgi:two-component system NtrC family response regulator